MLLLLPSFLFKWSHEFLIVAKESDNLGSIKEEGERGWMDGGTQSPETNASSSSNSSSSSEIVMIDETKGENEKDVSFEEGD